MRDRPGRGQDPTRLGSQMKFHRMTDPHLLLSLVMEMVDKVMVVHSMILLHLSTMATDVRMHVNQRDLFPPLHRLTIRSLNIKEVMVTTVLTELEGKVDSLNQIDLKSAHQTELQVINDKMGTLSERDHSKTKEAINRVIDQMVVMEAGMILEQMPGLVRSETWRCGVHHPWGMHQHHL